MKTKNKEKRVLNIDKCDFDIIKKYCDENSLKMPMWMTQLAICHIHLFKKYSEEINYGDNSKIPDIDEYIKKRFGSEEFKKYMVYAQKRVITT